MSETNDAPLAEGDAPESAQTETRVGTHITNEAGMDRWIPYDPTIVDCADMDNNTLYFPVAHNGGESGLTLTHDNCQIRIDMTEDYVVLGVQVIFP